MSGSTKNNDIPSNGIVVDVLNRENYSTWKVLVKNYLMGNDLWYGVIKDDEEEEEEKDEKQLAKENEDKPEDKEKLPQLEQVTKHEDNTQKEDEKKPEDKDQITQQKQVIKHEDNTQKEMNKRKKKEMEMKNRKALHAIQLSCGKMLGQIKSFDKAREAWDHLKTSLDEDVTAHHEGSSGTGFQSRHATNYDPNEDRSRSPLQKLVMKGFLDEAEMTIHDSPDDIFFASPIDGWTVLHVAVAKGREDIVKKLVMLGKEQLLKMQDRNGYTALALAAKLTDNRKMAAFIVENGGHDLLTMTCLRTKEDEDDEEFDEKVDEIPVLLASAKGDKAMTNYLFSKTPFSFLRQDKWKYGVVLLTRCISKGIFDVVAEMLRRDDKREIPLDHENKYLRPIYALAHIPSAFPSSVAKLPLLKRFIYHNIILKENYLSNENIEVVVQEPLETDRPIMKIHTLPGRLYGQLQQFVQTSILFKFEGFKELWDKKRDHYYVAEILDCLCKRVSILQEEELRKALAYDAMLQAGKNGITEFIESMRHANSVLLSAKDKSRRGIFAHAVLNREEKVFQLIHGVDNKEVITSGEDKLGNNLLHIAAELGPSSYLDRISNAALQMQRELQWFREVKKVVPQWCHDAKDPNGKSAEEIFTDDHEELLKSGQQWARDTASSFTLVGTLIITIMFAAAFTVPGGSESDNENRKKGLPVFLGKGLFTFFIISDAISLITSSSSVLMFIGILTSRYAQDDFIRSLPLKLLFGLFSLFLSVVSMMCAFCGALALLLKGYNKIVVAAMGLALIPILVFIPSLLRLASEIFQSTVKFSPLTANRKKIYAN